MKKWRRLMEHPGYPAGRWHRYYPEEEGRGSRLACGGAAHALEVNFGEVDFEEHDDPPAEERCKRCVRRMQG